MDESAFIKYLGGSTPRNLAIEYAVLNRGGYFTINEAVEAIRAEHPGLEGLEDKTIDEAFRELSAEGFLTIPSYTINRENQGARKLLSDCQKVLRKIVEQY